MLAQSFTPQELFHFYQAKLKAKRKKGDESMVDLGWEIAGLVRLDGFTRELIGEASEIKLNVIQGQLRSYRKEWIMPQKLML